MMLPMTAEGLSSLQLGSDTISHGDLIFPRKHTRGDIQYLRLERRCIRKDLTLITWQDGIQTPSSGTVGACSALFSSRAEKLFTPTAWVLLCLPLRGNYMIGESLIRVYLFIIIDVLNNISMKRCFNLAGLRQQWRGQMWYLYKPPRP